MPSEKSSRIFSSSSEGSGGNKRRHQQSHPNETDDKNSQTGVGNDSTTSQGDRVIKSARRKQEDKGYGIKDYVFEVGGDFQVFEDPQVDANLKNRRPDMMLTMVGLPQTKLRKRANEEGGEDENKENINPAGNTKSLQQKYNRKDVRIPLQELPLTNHRQNAQNAQNATHDDLFHSMAHELHLQNQIEHRRQLYLASIEVNKVFAGLAQKNRQGN